MRRIEQFRPIVLSLAFSTMFSSTTFSSSSRRLQRAKPSGAGRAGQGDQGWWPGRAGRKFGERAEFGLYLRSRIIASNPSSTNRRCALPTVLTLVSNAACYFAARPTFSRFQRVRFEQDPRLRDQLRRSLASAGQRLKPLHSPSLRLLRPLLVPATYSSPCPRPRRHRDSEMQPSFKDVMRSTSKVPISRKWG